MLRLMIYIMMGVFFIDGISIAENRENSCLKLGPLESKELCEAKKNGFIRSATEDDLKILGEAINALPKKDKYAALGGAPGPFDKDLDPSRDFVVQTSFKYPSGLDGGHAVFFIIPKGVPAPSGNPGHSEVFDLNSPHVCESVMCKGMRERDKEQEGL